MRTLNKLLLRLFLVMTLIGAFIMGRWSTGTSLIDYLTPKDKDGPYSDRRETNFLAIADDWKKYLAAHDGYIAEDIYRSLLRFDPNIRYDEFRDVYFTYLPVRLNPDLAKNPKYIVFSYFPWRLGTDAEWKYYADGTWEKVQLANQSEANLAITDGDVWIHDIPKLGLPDWNKVGGRDAWVAKNKDQLHWDETLREYVVTTQPAK